MAKLGVPGAGQLQCPQLLDWLRAWLSDMVGVNWVSKFCSPQPNRILNSQVSLAWLPGSSDEREKQYTAIPCSPEEPRNMAR